MEIAAYVCSHVFEDSKPVLLVSRAGGDWQCLCGGDHAADEVPNVVGLKHLLDRDSSLRELEDLPVDWEAEKATSEHKWIKTPLKPDQ